MNKPYLSLVIPVFNEETNLGELVRRCVDVCKALHKSCEIILVDDGSRDASAQMITQSANEHSGLVIGVLLNRNYGQHAAVMAGLAQSKGDVVVTLTCRIRRRKFPSC